MFVDSLPAADLAAEEFDMLWLPLDFSEREDVEEEDWGVGEVTVGITVKVWWHMSLLSCAEVSEFAVESAVMGGKLVIFDASFRSSNSLQTTGCVVCCVCVCVCVCVCWCMCVCV